MRNGTYNGHDVQMELVDFDVDQEVWITYTTKPDGVKLKVKLLVSEIMKVKDEFTDGGEPLHMFSHTIISSTSAPAHMQKVQKLKKVQ